MTTTETRLYAWGMVRSGSGSRRNRYTRTENQHAVQAQSRQIKQTDRAHTHLVLDVGLGLVVEEALDNLGMARKSGTQ